MITAANITDDMCRAVVALMPFDRECILLDGALAIVEPHRNHSRYELAKLWNALACASCTLRYLDSPNHPTGCIFVGWGHGWQPCSSCGGSGLSTMGNDLRDRAAQLAVTSDLRAHATKEHAE
jgi:hypothetical protein